MEYLWWDLGLCPAGSYVDIELRGAEAFVRLLDADNYQDYLDGGECTYYGGVWQTSPIDIEVPYDDHWYLVVDSYEGHIKVKSVTVTGD